MDTSKKEKRSSNELLVLVVNVLSSKMFQSKKKQLVEDLDFLTFSLVQSNMMYAFVPSTYFYEKLKFTIGIMISQTSEFLKENELWGRTSTLTKKCEYYQQYLVSIRDYSIHANFRVNVSRTLSSNYRLDDEMSAKECYEILCSMMNETYFSLFGYPSCSFSVHGDFASDHDNNGNGVPFLPSSFIFGPKNIFGKKKF